MPQRAIRREVHHGRMVRCFADRPANVDVMLRAAAGRRPDATAMKAGDASLTYRELDDRVESLARGLVELGLGAGDRIALLLGNRPEFLLALLAAARLGAIVVPLNVRQRRREILFMLSQCEAAAIVYEAELCGELPDPAQLPDLGHRIVVGEAHGVVGEAVQFESLLEPSPARAFDPVGEDDPFCILYTSGTTGTPKGATLTHCGVIHSAIHFEVGLGLEEGEVAALAVPASHVTGLVAILLAMLRVAGTSVFMKDFKARE